MTERRHFSPSRSQMSFAGAVCTATLFLWITYPQPISNEIAPKQVPPKQNPYDQEEDVEGEQSTAEPTRIRANVSAPETEDSSPSPRTTTLTTSRPMEIESELEEKVRQLSLQLSTVQDQLTKIQSELKTKDKSYPPVKFRNYRDRKRILVTGGTGFVGSHLVDRLMSDGHEVVALDNHYTGRKRNVQHWIGHPNFELVHHDIVNPFFIEVSEVYHLASPASPQHYMHNPVKTIKTNTLGSINMLGLARRVKARILLASTSEVYGDPEVHPQPETYWGHVNPIGPRSCYDEGKRVAEALFVAYQSQENLDIRIARIFNTFGPRMHMNDGRVVSTFIVQALQDQPITVNGDGAQTRSFQYVDDLVSGLVALMGANVTSPVNIGNPDENSIASFAEIIKKLTNSKSEIVHQKMPTDDPRQRRPDISKAEKLIGWKPTVTMMDGLKKTVEYFRRELEHNRLTGHSHAPSHPIEHYESENAKGS